MRLLLLSLSILLFASCSHTYYIVRHGEKQVQSGNNDPSLDEAGRLRAQKLESLLSHKKITHVFATKTNRAQETAAPTAAHFNLSTKTYAPMADSAFIQHLNSLKKNALVVGHSNTVDDIVNMLMNKKVIAGDLPESEFDNLFIIRVKGRKKSLEVRKY